MLDVETANTHIGPWLHDVANQRIHGTTGEKGVATNRAKLMDSCQAPGDHMITEFDMSCQTNRISQNHIVADNAVMGYVAVGHK